MIAAAADMIRARMHGVRWPVAVVLGSGWAPATTDWGAARGWIPMGEIPGFLPPVAEGHLGRVGWFDLGGVDTLVLSGRTHLYEGHGVGPVVHGVRVAAALGARLILLTNANGSLRDDEWSIGQPVLIRDHLNLTGVSPVREPIDLTHTWSPRLRALACRILPDLPEGVYAQLRGPHYNTAAEAEWMRRLGADLIGMSTIPEAIAARGAGLEVLGISTVTAIEGSDQATDPADVVAAAEATAARLSHPLREIVSQAVTGS